MTMDFDNYHKEKEQEAEINSAGKREQTFQLWRKSLHIAHIEVLI